jgi:ankyrin repeat protein
MIAKRKSNIVPNKTENAYSLTDAARRGDADLFSSLLSGGADINAVDPADGLAALHIACTGGDDTIVALILEHDQKYGTVDFELRAGDPPRKPWQLAISAHHYELGNKVDSAGISKSRARGTSFDPKP